MDTDNIVVTLHPRNNWQSFDLGTRLGIRWWRALYGFWFIVAFPFFLLSNIISPEYGIFLLWWLKPVFEMGLLHMLSRNIFQQQTGIKDTLKVFLRIVKPSILPALTWRRLAPSRGFNLAVSQLEGLKGTARARRINVLHRRTEGIYWWLIICAHIEVIIIFGLISLIVMMTPEGSDFWAPDYFFEGSFGSDYVLNVISFISMWLIAPLYQAGSFMAYLNRRVILEGWDIELQLKGIAKKLKAATTSTAIVCVVFVCSQLAVTEPVYANTNTAQTSESLLDPLNLEIPVAEIDFDEGNEGDAGLNLTEDEKAAQAQTRQWMQDTRAKLDAILEEEPFVEEYTTYDWEWQGWKSDEQEPEERKTDTTPFALLGDIAMFLAKSAEVIFWLFFIAIAASVIWLTRHQIKRLFGEKKPEIQQTQVIPDFIARETHTQPQTALDYSVAIDKALKSQDWRVFMSLMLISSLQVAQQKHELKLHKSNTEKECLRKILIVTTESESHYFDALFAAWITVAWSQNSLQQEIFENLFEQWRQHIATGLVAL